ncbi:MAG: CDP-alcohol phosphatidyltransferase family protein [Deltaproteobacteria bacterium]|nr:CDP-alcohol phosphatidyltransferase family protein [Deltaproteobacteria bacterium]
MNIPNLLTILRILLVPVFIVFVIDDNILIALAIFILAGITDGLDGFIARVFNQRTVIGTYLDPIADKMLLISAYISLTIKGILPGWLSVVVVSRDIIILSGIAVISLMGKDIDVKPSVLSKITTVFQISTIIIAFLSLNQHSVFWIGFIILTTIFTILSGLQYMYRGVKAMGGIR